MLDEVLSTYAEVHAFGIGLYEGFKDFTDFDGLDKSAKKNPDVKKEIHYAKIGYVIGAILRVGIIFFIAYYIT